MSPAVEKILADTEDSTLAMVVKTTIQLNFIARVTPSFPDAHTVVLNPQEHQDYAWVSKEDLEQYKVSDGMRRVVMDALIWAEENINKING